jgi:hypothetical protein
MFGSEEIQRKTVVGIKKWRKESSMRWNGGIEISFLLIPVATGEKKNPLQSHVFFSFAIAADDGCLRAGVSPLAVELPL